jgi:hypothetical protein
METIVKTQQLLTSTQMLLLEVKSARSVCDNADRLFVYDMIIERIETRFIEIEKELIRYAHERASVEAGYEYSAEDWSKEFIKENFKSNI